MYNGSRVSFLGLMRPGHGVEQPPPSSTDVKERVELYRLAFHGLFYGKILYNASQHSSVNYKVVVTLHKHVYILCISKCQCKYCTCFDHWVTLFRPLKYIKLQLQFQGNFYVKLTSHFL